ncbi:hypothetical protein LRAMOSA11492 [Lichtheimia ramosa]|uniref:Uncharacterized protein n=1 Tax=Lichtheimia ramosa TaxID=688394 RepID=A0A077WXR7_9FUNG|nr:hypothetical protein LRAMOSA11492 [Lichtheimia ramosa]
MSPNPTQNDHQGNAIRSGNTPQNAPQGNPTNVPKNQDEDTPMGEASGSGKKGLKELSESHIPELGPVQLPKTEKGLAEYISEGNVITTV